MSRFGITEKTPRFLFYERNADEILNESILNVSHLFP